MSIKRELPLHWAERLTERGFVKQRGTGPSPDRLATAAGLHTSTVTSALFGDSTPTADTVLKLCEQLGDDVAEWLGFERPREWSLPTEAVLLTIRQREAVIELILSMAEKSRRLDQEPGTVLKPRRRAGRTQPQGSQRP